MQPNRTPRRAPIAALLGLALVLIPAMTGCGGDDEEGGKSGDGGSSATYLIDKDIDHKAWEAIVSADPDLGKLVGEAGLSFQAAGEIEDGDGAKLQWAEYAGGADDPREQVIGVFYACSAKGECKAGKANYTADGAKLVYADGTAVDRLPIGMPSNAKRLAKSGLDSGEVIALELNRKHIVSAELGEQLVKDSTWGKRRLLVLNTWGPQTGVSPNGWKASHPAELGAFDEVVEINYVRRRDIHALLPKMTPLDVVVWLGAGVVKPYGTKPYRSMGMTVSRGVVGDSLFSHKDLGKMLDAPPLGGPGLVILAGSDSLTSDYNHADVLGYSLNLGPYRPVVGIEGKVGLADAEKAARALIVALQSGKTLDVALAATTPTGGAWQTPLPTKMQEAWKLAPARAAFWDKVPGSATLEMYVKMDAVCADISAGGGKCNPQTFQGGTAIPPEKLTPILDTKFICNPTIAGPYFDCTAKNATTFTDFWLKGLLAGRGEGGSIFVYAQGSPDGKVRDIAVVGAGAIEKVDAGGGTTTISFGGPAAASTFVNGDGQCCIVKGPLLSGHASHLLSKLTIKP